MSIQLLPIHYCGPCGGRGQRLFAVPCSDWNTDPDSDFVEHEWGHCGSCGGDGLSPAGKKHVRWLMEMNAAKTAPAEEQAHA